MSKSLKDYVKSLEKSGDFKDWTFVVLSNQASEDDQQSTAAKILKISKALGAESLLLNLDDSLLWENDVFSEALKAKDTTKCVFFVRGSFVNAEGLAVLNSLQRSGYHLFNSPSSTLLAQNKFQCLNFYSQEGITTPHSALVSNTSEETLKKLNKYFSEFPVVAKPLAGAEGIGVTIIESERSFKGSLENYLRLDDSVLVQDFLKSDTDYRGIVLNGKFFAGTKRKKSNKDFRSNLGHGVVPEAFDAPKDHQKWCEKIARLGNFNYVAIDYVEEKGKLTLLEVNGSPGSGSVYSVNSKEVDGFDLVKTMIEQIVTTEWSTPAAKTCGEIESVAIEGLEEVHCKMDTGNESYNSVHAEDIEIDEKTSKVSFTLWGKEFTKPLESTVLIRHSSLEKRPVISLDFTFDGKSYTERFNLTDRSEKEYEVLFGKKFMNKLKLAVNPSQKFLLGNATDESLEESISRKNATKALREFKSIMALLFPEHDVSGLDIEIDGVTLGANYKDDGTLTSLTVTGPRGRKLIKLVSGQVLDKDEIEAKIGSVR